MRIQFTKMHGLGNDFVVIDAITQHVSLRPAQIVKLAHRHTGVGFDQLLLIEPPSRPDADFDYRIFNADGQEVEHCGNGARCFARFVTDRGLTQKAEIRVNTARGLIVLSLTEQGLVCVNMGQPQWIAQSLPYRPPPAPDSAHQVILPTPKGDFSFGLVSMGNPHAVTVVADVDQAEVALIGRAVQALPQFPESVNVGFMAIQSRTQMDLRVFERGVGETLACGTGACAAVAVARQLNRVDEQVQVITRGGPLTIQWAGLRHDLFMTGPAETVFEGELRL